MNHCVCGYTLEITVMKNNQTHHYCMNPHCQAYVLEEECSNCSSRSHLRVFSVDRIRYHAVII